MNILNFLEKYDLIVDYYLYLLFLLLYLIFIIVVLPEENIMKKLLVLLGACLVLLLTLIIYIIFNQTSFKTLYCFVDIGSFGGFIGTFLSVDLIFCFDTFNLTLLLLTNLIFVFSVYYSIYTIKFVPLLYYLLLTILFFLLNIIFCVLDLFIFYVLFEMILIPLFVLIGLWGNRLHRLRAAILFYIYTAFFSFFFLLGLLFIYLWFGTYNYIIIKNLIDFSCYYSLTCYSSVYYSIFQLKFIWLIFFIFFIVKLPLIPFHIWLPEAHVESPTVCSVILASLVLKLGGYGLIRFLLPLSHYLTVYFSSLLLIIGIVSFLYSTFIAIVQVDLKKIIAYSSIAHMSLFLIGISLNSYYSLIGSWLMLLSHGLVSSALFFLVGILYTRFNTRLVKYFSGISVISDKINFFFFFFILSNIGFPGSINFISEVLIFIGILPKLNIFCVILIGTGFIMSLLYSVWVYNRMFLGTFSTNYLTIYYDLKTYEYNILFTLLIIVLFLGFFPKNLFFNIF